MVTFANLLFQNILLAIDLIIINIIIKFMLLADSTLFMSLHVFVREHAMGYELTGSLLQMQSIEHIT